MVIKAIASFNETNVPYSSLIIFKALKFHELPILWI